MELITTSLAMDFYLGSGLGECGPFLRRTRPFRPDLGSISEQSLDKFQGACAVPIPFWYSGGGIITGTIVCLSSQFVKRERTAYLRVSVPRFSMVDRYAGTITGSNVQHSALNT